jgi:hypothetical protein
MHGKRTNSQIICLYNQPKSVFVYLESSEGLKAGWLFCICNIQSEFTYHVKIAYINQ